MSRARGLRRQLQADRRKWRRAYAAKVTIYRISGGIPGVVPEPVEVKRGRQTFVIVGGLPDLAGDPRPPAVPPAAPHDM